MFLHILKIPLNKLHKLLVPVLGMDRKLLMLLEEIKTQNTTQTLLLQQLLNAREMRVEENAEDEFGLPLSAREQLLKMEADCRDRDQKAKLVRVWIIQAAI